LEDENNHDVDIMASIGSELDFNLQEGALHLNYSKSASANPQSSVI